MGDDLYKLEEASKGSNEAIKWRNHGYKYFPQKNMSCKDIIKSTKNGPAKYKPGIDTEALERMVWKKGTSLTNGKTQKVMEFSYIIGASAGSGIKYMGVEMSG